MGRKYFVLKGRGLFIALSISFNYNGNSLPPILFLSASLNEANEMSGKFEKVEKEK